jgi:hypothetical protein
MKKILLIICRIYFNKTRAHIERQPLVNYWLHVFCKLLVAWWIGYAA